MQGEHHAALDCCRGGLWLLCVALKFLAEVDKWAATSAVMTHTAVDRTVRKKLRRSLHLTLDCKVECSRKKIQQ